MKLDEKIADRKVVYLFRKEASIAFELGLLYFVSAKRKNAGKKIAAACFKAIYWLKKSQVRLPEYIKQLSPAGQLEEIEKVLVINKAKIGARAGEPVHIPELCRQFGLA